MTHPRFFGYGSLVNLATHDYPGARAATLSGWRRVWRHAKTRPVAFLSVEPHDTTIIGITAEVPNADWTALDLREHAYLRRDVSDQFGGDPTAVYEANPAHTAHASTGHPILLSYLDVVVAGFCSLSPNAADHFFETTTGWGPVLNDRADPLYPRAQPLSAKTTATVDAQLAALAVPVQPAEDARLLVDVIRTARIALPLADDAQG